MACSQLRTKGLKTNSYSSLEVYIAFQNAFVFPFPKFKTQGKKKASEEASIFVFTFILLWTSVGFIALLSFYFFPQVYYFVILKLTLLFLRRNYTSEVKIYENERKKTMY